MARRKISCKVPGCDYSGHILKKHAREEHGLSVDDYTELYSAPLVSAYGREKIAEKKAAEKPAPKAAKKAAKKPASNLRPVKVVSVNETFDVDFGPERDFKGNPKLDSKGIPIPKTYEILAFTEPGPDTPDIDPFYSFRADYLKWFLIGMDDRDRILLTGPTGSGKTTFVLQVAARLNYNVKRINFDLGVRREQLVGVHQFKDDETYFVDGVLPQGMEQPGTIILLDEWDAKSGDVSMILQPVLEKGHDSLVLLEDGGRVVKLHPQNLIAATGNTKGAGDSSGLYAHGTSVQNFSQVDRFTGGIPFEYISQADESKILERSFREDDDGNVVDYPEGKPALSDDDIARFTKVAVQVRDGFLEGTISVPMSTRTVINWARKFWISGEVRESLHYCLLSKLEKADALAIDGFVQRVFEQE